MVHNDLANYRAPRNGPADLLFTLEKLCKLPCPSVSLARNASTLL